MPSAEDAKAGDRETPRLSWRVNLVLFLATVASCLVTVVVGEGGVTRTAFVHAAQFTAALLAILLAHEFGHYTAARIHKVDASLPFFIPLPVLSPFGTMGAVIRMRSVIPTRRALFDIGASGPLAGLALAIPLYVWGVAHSEVVAVDGPQSGIQLGSSLLSMAADHLFGPRLTEGTDILLSPVAFAAWAGMFVTMINLLPAGQLDGGHVAYALFGRRQDAIAQWVHRSMLAFFFVSLASFLLRDIRAGMGLHHLGLRIHNSLFWLVWFEVLAVIGAVSTAGSNDAVSVRTRVTGTVGLALMVGFLYDRTQPLVWVTWFVGLGFLLAIEVRWGALRRQSALVDHPPTGAEQLGTGRAVLAVFTLLLFVLLFMPTPFAI